MLSVSSYPLPIWSDDPSWSCLLNKNVVLIETERGPKRYILLVSFIIRGVGKYINIMWKVILSSSLMFNYMTLCHEGLKKNIHCYIDSFLLCIYNKREYNKNTIIFIEIFPFSSQWVVFKLERYSMMDETMVYNLLRTVLTRVNIC